MWATLSENPINQVISGSYIREIDLASFADSFILKFKIYDYLQYVIILNYLYRLFESVTYNSVCNTVVHSSKVDDDNGQNKQSIRWTTDHWPNVDQYQRPPLKDEDDDEDGHHLGGVPVPSGVHVDQLGRLSHLDEDRSVGKGDCAEEEDLDDADHLSVYQTCSCAHVDETPEVNVFTKYW